MNNTRKNYNYIYLPKIELDKPIYRVISVNRLFELFEKRINVLVKPKLWEDPYENFIMNSKGETQDGEMFDIDFRDNFYGQCWTKTRNSDGIWRIYSPDKNGARIETTPRKLFDSLYSKLNNIQDISCFIGKVKYFSESKLKSLLEEKGSDWINDINGIGQAKTLLFKRDAFEYENEVRLIYNSFKLNSESDTYSYKIDPHDLIDKITFDPRIDYAEFRRHKQNLIHLNYNDENILKSTLYKTPNLKFKLKK